MFVDFLLDRFFVYLFWSSLYVLCKFCILFCFCAELRDIRISYPNLLSIRLFYDARGRADFAHRTSGSKHFVKSIEILHCRWLSCIFLASFTWMLLSEHGIGLNTPSDLINRCSPSFIFCSSFLARASATQMTFSISVSEQRAISAHCSSVKYERPGIVSIPGRSYLDFCC